MTIRDGVYRIKNVRSGTYFDNSASKRDVIHGWASRDNDNQKWEVNRRGDGYTIKNVASGRYASASSSDNGTDVKAREEPTEWHIEEDDGAYVIKRHGSNAVIDLDKGDKDNGTCINVWAQTNAKQQRWEFESVGGGGGGGEGGYGRRDEDRGEGASYGSHAGQQPVAPPNRGYQGPVQPGRYVIKNLQTGTVIDLAAGRSDEGAPIVGWSQGGGDNQKWDFEYGQSGYRIRNAASGTYLGHQGDANEATLMCGHSQAVEWDVKQSDQGYQFQRVGSNYVLDLARGSAENGAQVCLWSNNSAPNQKWSVDRA